ncbi:asparagine synthase-related protein [Candidatus Borrarchaeum sp.]|uniref:asparagine synthase-related protein n=1 Tax=Candidatus Borrarchaeum sp. TaxID=2846742 RepID=UPI00257C9632|nr:asparagine synthase-related protein [Candidatus Borrarchaeum sp.]
MQEHSIKKYTDEILRVFNEVIQDYYADAFLLSGGLDTSIVAALVSRYFKPITLSVGFSDSDAPDLYYAKIVADRFSFQNFVKLFTLEEAAEAAEYVIKTLRTFDPMEIRNDITIYIGLKYLKEFGVKSVLTGDGGDELFAGYSFMFELEPCDVDKWITEGVERWSFSAKPIGESLGLRVFQPILDERIIDLALKIPAELKIAERKGITHGKYILRKAFEEILSPDVVWRPKYPIEAGSGSTNLSTIFCIETEEFNDLSKIVPLDSQEQAYYFKIYRETVGEIPPPNDNEKICPRCGGGVAMNKNYCKICGLYPVKN